MPKARLVFDGDNVYIGKDGRIYGLKNDIASKIDGIPGVINNLDSTSTTDALSANMGRELQDQINSMSGIGTFLSTWDCTTGLPGTNPQQDPYTYKVGDYYIVSEVGATNYKPHGGTFTQGVPSTTVETENVGINDKYYFDGADWVRIPNTAIQITIDSALSTLSTNAVENRAIATAINTKQDIISDLSTIRTGASKGATALQPNDNISQLANNVGYQTAGDVASAIAGKQDILSAGDGISITSNTVTNTKPGPTISGTAPANPTEGMLWYDSTNDVLKVYDGSAWQEVGSDAANINTKTFYLSSTSDLTNAQAAYDWYLAGNNPIVVINNQAFILEKLDLDNAKLIFVGGKLYPAWSSVTYLCQRHLWLGYNNSGTITSIHYDSDRITQYLDTTFDYGTPYVPQHDGSPATKKYVDDSVADVIPSGGTAPQNPQEGDLWYDTVNDKLMVYDGANWVSVDTDTTYTAGTNVQISAQNVISATDTTYTAGEGISILNGDDYSAMRGPCPKGFHIPLSSEWQDVLNILEDWDVGIENYSTVLKLPIPGHYIGSDGNTISTGESRYHCSNYGDNLVCSAYLNIDNQGGIWLANARNKGDGLLIRAFKNEPVIPTSSWTKLYWAGDIENGGVYYNATEGLTSLSSDGTTWITIEDKNLGATNVGDSGLYYQWGNCYGFTYGSVLTTSSTQVDASGYGPGNYYSSSTFITATSRDSSNNNNLWGGETGIVQFHNAITNTGVTSVNGQTGDVVSAIVSNIMPSKPKEGMLWYDTANSALKIYYNSNWVNV